VNLAAFLALERPLCVMDLETTGPALDRDRIIQVAITMHYPDQDPRRWWSYVDPEMAIPPEATQVHKIADADIAGAPTWRELGPVLAPRLAGCDFCGYNVDFDLQFFRAECRRAGVDWDWEGRAHVVDAKAIYFIKSPRDLSAAHREFVGCDFDGAHDAGADVAATEAVLAAQLSRYADLPRTVKALHAFCFPQKDGAVDRAGKIVWRNNEACIGFGKKHNGQPLRLVDRGYLEWMLNGEFPADTKAIVREALAGNYPRRTA
jgi:DNA polymerase III subunit epsilon